MLRVIVPSDGCKRVARAMYHVKSRSSDTITRQRKSTHITTTTTAKCEPSFTTPLACHSILDPVALCLKSKVSRTVIISVPTSKSASLKDTQLYLC